MELSRRSRTKIHHNSGQAAAGTRDTRSVPIILNSPLAYLTGSARSQAVDDVRTYMTSYTGRFFEALAARSDPDCFEASDLVAVSCLSVDIDPETAGWLLVGDGQRETADLLAVLEVPPWGSLRDYDLASNEAALALWELLSDRRQLGPTRVSKLLAAKRSHLVPIFDSFVADALLPPEHRRNWQWWGPWRDVLLGPDGQEIAKAVNEIRMDAAESNGRINYLSDLRVLDVVIWMAEDRRRRQNAPRAPTCSPR